MFRCCPYRNHEHECGCEIVDVDERTRFLAGSLDGKRNNPLRNLGGKPFETQGKLRQDVLPAHVRPINIMGAKDENAIEVLAAVVDGHQLANDLPAAIRVSRI